MHPVDPMPKDCCLTAVHLAAFIPKSPAYDRSVRSSESARRYRGAAWGSLGVSQVLRSRHLSICAGLPLIALLPSCLLSKPDFYSSGCQEPALQVQSSRHYVNQIQIRDQLSQISFNASLFVPIYF